MKSILAILLFLLSTRIYAESSPIPGNFAIHIAPRNYVHPVRFVHPYIDVWHMKGPMMESVASEMLPHYFDHIGMCKATQQADAVISLEPQVFYNAQIRLFYVEVIAQVYAGSSQPIAKARAEIKQVGELSSMPEYALRKGYEAALQKVMQELLTQNALSVASKQTSQTQTEALCRELDRVPPSEIYY